jgi:cobalt-zinc-cadmium efflux system outer membrane protein
VLRCLVTLCWVAGASALAAQQPVTRADAIVAALSRGARAAFGRADTAAAAATLHAARLYPNPSLAATYTKDTPHYHVIADVPLDLPWLRGARIGAAAAARDAARYGFAFERAAIRFDVDTAYTHAVAARAHARLSRRTALDADSLLRMAQLRHQVGDVGELDVRLAEVNAGLLENVAAEDSLTALDALVQVQLAMGLPGDQLAIVLVDSLVAPDDTTPGFAREPLPVAAAAADLRAQERTLTLAHRNLLPAPSVQVGVEQGDPAGPGVLPTVGVALAIPLFNWNGGEVRQAAAARDRARANFDLVQRESQAALARARRAYDAARVRLARDQLLLAAADTVAAMSLQAYAEGAVALPSLLEAHRNAREALGRYIDDLAAANNAAAALRLLTGAEQP